MSHKSLQILTSFSIEHFAFDYGYFLYKNTHDFCVHEMLGAFVFTVVYCFMGSLKSVTSCSKRVKKYSSVLILKFLVFFNGQLRYWLDSSEKF